MTKAELERYSRHLLLPEIGMKGQQRLAESRVLIVGLGGLGSPAALYLAAAGVGTIGIIDPDLVDRSNLQRQVIYGEASVGKSKVEAGAERLEDLNPLVEVLAYEERLTAENALDIISHFDLVLDGTDNFETRYLVNDACVLTRTPNVFASIDRFAGQVGIFGTAEGPCYRCLYPEPPSAGTVKSCAEAGVLGVLPGVMGTLQATEALKLLLNIGKPLIGRIARYDALEMTFSEVRLQRDPECSVCGSEPSIHALSDVDYVSLCGLPQQGEMEIAASDYRKREEGDHYLLDVRQPEEYEAGNLGGVLIPIGELQQRLGELPQDRPIIVHCRSGARSLQAVELLRAAGFQNAKSIKGGIEAVLRERSDALNQR